MGLTTLRQELKTFCQSTSIKGVSKTAKSQFLALKAMWVLVVLCGTAIGMWQICNLLIFYLSFTTTTSITSEERYQPFPDVTLCNLQSLRSAASSSSLNVLEDYYTMVNSQSDVFLQQLRNMKDSGDLSEYIKKLLPDDNEELLPENNEETSPRGQKNNKPTTPANNQTSYSPPNPKERNILRQTMLNEYMTLRGFVQNAPAEVLEDIGHLPEIFITSCHWKYKNQGRIGSGEPCDRDKDIKLTPNPNYGNCFTIKAENNEVYPIAGLKLILQLDEFVPFIYPDFDEERDIQTGRGVLVSFQVPGTMPDLTRAISVSPGTSTSITLDTTIKKKIGHPFGNCDDSMYTNTSKTGYVPDQFSCYMDCLQDEVITECHCIDVTLPFSEKDLQKHSFCCKLNEINDTGSLQKQLCYLTLVLDGSSCEKKCQVPCESVSYMTAISQNPWPQEAYHPAFIKKFSPKFDPSLGEELFGSYKHTLHQLSDNLIDNKEALQDLQGNSLITRNFLELRIRFFSKDVTIFEQQPAMTWEALFGSFGGILNLWIGINIITLFEFWELFYRMFVACCPRMFQENKVEVLR